LPVVSINKHRSFTAFCSSCYILCEA